VKTLCLPREKVMENRKVGGMARIGILEDILFEAFLKAFKNLKIKKELFGNRKNRFFKPD
jgi:hypothetical protein